MRKLAFVLLLALLPFMGWAQQQKKYAPYKAGEVIVKFKDGHSSTRRSAKLDPVSADLKKLGITQANQLMPLTSSMTQRSRRAGISDGNTNSGTNLSTLYVLRFDKGQSVEETIEKLKQSGEVEYAEPNYIVKAMGKAPETSLLSPSKVNETNRSQSYNDPKYDKQWGLQAINMPALWEKPVISSKRPVIAILDTGVDINHPDLADNIWTNEAEKGNDEDGNGFIGDVHGWDFVSNSSDISDPDGHGTHCAGIAAAVGNNGIGIVGANPNALIMPLRVLDDAAEGYVDNIIQGIDYAIANGADVLSMSYGYQCPYGPSEAERDALLEASYHAVLVAAVGNNGVCMNSTHHGLHGNPDVEPSPSYPAAFTFVIGVQASDENGKLASYSNFDCGVTPPSEYLSEPLSYELVAPGDDIISTLPNGQYGVKSGTSMVCPLVAGAISSLIQRRIFNNNQELLTTLTIANNTGIVDMAAAYSITELPQHQINEVFTANINGVDMTFKVKSPTTVQLGSGNEESAFDGNLTDITIPSQVDGFTVTSIGSYAFLVTDVESVTLPNTIKYLDRSSFFNATHLKSLNIPENVTDIGWGALSNCTSLEGLHISKNVIAIGEGAFSDCPVLKSISVDKDNTRYDSRDNCNAIIETATNTLLVGTTTIPSGVEIIGRGAFEGTNIETITIPNTVKVIGRGAFDHCYQLKEINIPEGVTTIDFAAFSNCTSLTSLYIPKSVEYINEAFHKCENLKSVVVNPANPVYDSRDNCNAIIETETNTLMEGFNCTTIPDGITGIAPNAFYYCQGLKTVTISKDIVYIGPAAFMGCNNLNSIVVVAGNPVFDSRDNCNAIIETATNTLVFGNHASTIPSSVKTIGESAFDGTEFIDTDILIHEGVEKIKEYAFFGLHGVKITLPSSIKSIEENALNSNEEGNIKEIYCYRKTPLPISKYVFREVAASKLYVPRGQKSAYENAKGWKKFGTIVEMDVEGADPPIEIEPMIESTETTFGGEEDIIDEETNLTNVVIDNTYYTMDAENGDGYDIEQQALVLNSITTEESMNTIKDALVGEDAVRDNFNGIIFEVPAGKGTVTIDAQTIGTHTLMVQIGKGEPRKVTKSERGMVNVDYYVSVPTYIYLYAATEGSAGSRLNRAPVANENSVLLYGLKVDLLAPFVLGDADGDGSVDVNDVTSTINYILNKPVAKFIIEAADMDQDGKIDVNDVQAIIYKALGK